jgi:D-sedoheptulose 7-phosphate isomerase
MKPEINFLAQDIRELKTLLNSDLTELQNTFADVSRLCADALIAGKKLIVCGNGGSAADVEHFAGEIVGRFGFDRPSLPCVSLCTPSATFTAIANDYGYENVFKRQLQGYAQAGDVFIGISTSGNSANVVAAFELAKKLNIKSVALTGAKDSRSSEIADYCLRSPSCFTPRIQEIHGVVIHSLCRAIEAQVFAKQNIKARVALPTEKIVAQDQLSKFSKAISGHKTVFTNGCFDILHPGHVMLLKQARNMGDLLIVGLNTDDSVSRLKGPKRPYHSFEDRAAVLTALECVDFVVGFEEDTPKRLIETLTPKILVKGGDYSIETIVGADWVTKHGGEVKVIPLLDGHSTTGILKSNGK